MKFWSRFSNFLKTMNIRHAKTIEVRIKAQTGPSINKWWLHVYDISFVTSILLKCGYQISLITQITWPFRNSLTFQSFHKFQQSGNPGSKINTKDPVNVALCYSGNCLKQVMALVFLSHPTDITARVTCVFESGLAHHKTPLRRSSAILEFRPCASTTVRGIHSSVSSVA